MLQPQAGAYGVYTAMIGVIVYLSMYGIHSEVDELYT